MADLFLFEYEIDGMKLGTLLYDKPHPYATFDLDLDGEFWGTLMILTCEPKDEPNKFTGTVDWF